LVVSGKRDLAGIVIITMFAALNRLTGKMLININLYNISALA
jgi:hypothetical protein